MEGKNGKTERATSKKRKKEREEGNLCLSPEINSVGVLVLGIIGLRLSVPGIWERLHVITAQLLGFNNLGAWDVSYIRGLIASILIMVSVTLAPLVLLVMLGSIIGNMAQTGPYFSAKTMKLKFSALNPTKGVKKLVNAQSLVKLPTSLLKIGLIVFVAWLFMRTRFGILLSMSRFGLPSSVAWIMKTVYGIAITVSLVFIFIALIDWAVRKYKHEQGMMMSKQEVKEERKQEQISPLVKRAQMKKMHEFSLMRMMAAVPKASVVVTNPTHVAVALEYTSDDMDAPKVTAKGMRHVAQRIKKIARENNVPIVEKPEIARALYKDVEIGREIPAKFYEAVAEILAYLYKLGKGIEPAN